MPLAARRASEAATVSSGGNRRGGNIPACATASHAAPTPRKGHAVRAAARRRAFTRSTATGARDAAGTSSGMMRADIAEGGGGPQAGEPAQANVIVGACAAVSFVAVPHYPRQQIRRVG